ncbi:hypothetical protein F383_20323 [Gossypium arboreum]|uniref:Uncharacterized protein n=1 Tax=Gossypium arboreum TaxID=29729 RepID=A0A0B0NKS2_GOSAR|nr:hypothetical protein F383_20323 [Gossypium arboreum]
MPVWTKIGYLQSHFSTLFLHTYTSINCNILQLNRQPIHNISYRY